MNISSFEAHSFVGTPSVVSKLTIALLCVLTTELLGPFRFHRTNAGPNEWMMA